MSIILRVLAALVFAGFAGANASAQDRPLLTLEQVVSASLANSYPVRHQRDELRRREAELRITEGAFDLSLGFSASRSRISNLHGFAERQALDVATSESGLTAYRVGASKRFRTGILIQPGVEFSRQDARTFRTPSTIRARAVLALEYPLLQGGNRRLESAAVDAAEAAVESEDHRLHDIRAQSVFRAAAAFWLYRGAGESLLILLESEAKARRLLEETTTLVTAGERPASDLDQLRAELADRAGARSRAEHALFEARQQLGRELNLTPDEAAALPQPESAFPDPPGVAAFSPSPEQVAAALARREDLAGVRREIVAGEIMVAARRKAARPQLNLRFEAGIAGLTEGDLHFGQYFPPYGQNDVSGRSGTVSLIFDLPAENNVAAGMLARQEATLRQAKLLQTELERSIISNILIADAQLRSTAAELRQAEEAVRLFSLAVESERKKVQLNVSTQFDLILVEERLRNAMLARISARVRFAQAVARLRYETGTLLLSDSAAETAMRLHSPLIFSDHE